MHFKAPEVKGMGAAKIREELSEYIEAVQPCCGQRVLTEELLTAVRTRSTERSDDMKWFLTSERLIADQTKDYRIHDMIEYLRQVDRFVRRKGRA